jgi:hypothetical protein
MYIDEGTNKLFKNQNQIKVVNGLKYVNSWVKNELYFYTKQVRVRLGGFKKKVFIIKLHYFYIQL